jgi:hypothetical protein
MRLERTPSNAFLALKFLLHFMGGWTFQAGSGRRLGGLSI